MRAALDLLCHRPFPFFLLFVYFPFYSFALTAPSYTANVLDLHFCRLFFHVLDPVIFFFKPFSTMLLFGSALGQKRPPFWRAPFSPGLSKDPRILSLFHHSAPSFRHSLLARAQRSFPPYRSFLSFMGRLTEQIRGNPLTQADAADSSLPFVFWSSFSIRKTDVLPHRLY